MVTPPRVEQPEEAGKPNKGKFFFADDGDSDEDEMQGFLALKKATYDDTQEEDIIDQTIRQELEKCQNPSLGASDHAQAGLQSPDEKFSELFVSPNEECQVDNSPSKPQLNVEADPVSDDDFMIIDATEASADAQEKWAVPRDFVVDLTKVKQEPQTETQLPDSPQVKRSASEEVSIAAVPRHKQDGAGIETLEKEKAELTDKALRGALSPGELSQLLQITAQLNGAKGSNIPHQPDDAKPPINGKAKKPRKVTTKEEYWAKQAENERKKKQELREHGRKTTGKSKTAQTKKAKTSLTSTKPQGDGDSSDEDDQEALGEIERQIAEMLGPLDAILERSKQGELPAEPDIRATRKEDQLRQMRKAAPGYFEKKLLEKQEKELRDSTKAWGPWGVRPKNGKWEIRRVLINPLHNHQIVVGAWMMGRELKNTPRLPRGGILADAMGLGKTIETLSCISGNPSSDRLKDKGQGATLVVCPSQQMIGVWMSEVNKHCGKRFARDMVQYKRQNKMDVDLLGSFNIVLATYHQVRASIPSVKEQQEMQKELADTEKYNKWLAESTGDLHRIKWYRVVLDEAHSIKNHLTHGAFACFELQAKYRWVVSGTPLINSDDEFFSYLKFTRCHGIEQFSDYQKEYQGGNDWFLGQPILNLPPTFPTHQNLQLSDEETVIFRMMERCFRRKVNYDLQQGDGHAEKQVRSYLTILLRLRQAATHPFLLESMMNEYFTLKDLRLTKEKLAELKGKKTIYEQIGSWNKRHEPPPEQVRKPFGQSNFGLHFDMDKQIEYLERLEEISESHCTVCNVNPPVLPVKGQCGCIFCTQCLIAHSTTKGRICPTCRKVVGITKALEAFHSGVSDDESDSPPEGRRRHRMNNKEYAYGFDQNGFQHYEDDRKAKKPIRFLQISDKTADVPVTPSGKMAALKDTVLRWQAEAPQDKIIVFSQFNVVMKIIGRMVEGEGIPFAYLSGKQTTEQREKSVEDFQEGDVVKVLVVSLRAGGQCLNLTRGNRVILMELWWNHAVEQQAFSRVFRIGQIKETHFVRFIVNTPIEKRMLRMQVNKILRIDAALQDEGVRTPKIGLEDIAKLLGKVVRRNGVMQVVADYSDDDDDEEDDVDMPGSRAARRAAEEEADLSDFVVDDDEVEFEVNDDDVIGLSDDEDGSGGSDKE
ncbi:hypothetical protein K456DRAFT_1932703 [Colletotrichum gloeosporioides 23]|nr:hypothetical protein K456DRAFT_1932703 [Colletotrichum gloeosporioides 23]